MRSADKPPFYEHHWCPQCPGFDGRHLLPVPEGAGVLVLDCPEHGKQEHWPQADDCWCVK